MSIRLDSNGRARLNADGRAHTSSILPPCGSCGVTCGGGTQRLYGDFSPGTLADDLVIPFFNVVPGPSGPLHVVDEYLDNAMYAQWHSLTRGDVARYFPLGYGGGYGVSSDDVEQLCAGGGDQPWLVRYNDVDGLALDAPCLFATFDPHCHLTTPATRMEIGGGVSRDLRTGVHWEIWWDYDGGEIYVSAYSNATPYVDDYAIRDGVELPDDYEAPDECPPSEAFFERVASNRLGAWAIGSYLGQPYPIRSFPVLLFRGSVSIPSGYRDGSDNILLPVTINNELTTGMLGTFTDVWAQRPGFEVRLVAHAGGSLTILPDVVTCPESSADVTDAKYALADFSQAAAQQPTGLIDITINCDGGPQTPLPPAPTDPCDIICFATGLPPADCDPGNCPPVPYPCPYVCADGSIPDGCDPKNCPNAGNIGERRWYQCIDCCTGGNLLAAVLLPAKSPIDAGRITLDGEDYCVGLRRDRGWPEDNRPSQWEPVTLANPVTGGCGTNGINIESKAGVKCCELWTLTPCDGGGSIVTDTDLSDAIGTATGGGNQIVEIDSTSECYTVVEGGSGTAVSLGGVTLHDTCEICESCDLCDFAETYTLEAASILGETPPCTGTIIVANYSDCENASAASQEFQWGSPSPDTLSCKSGSRPHGAGWNASAQRWEAWVRRGSSPNGNYAILTKAGECRDGPTGTYDTPLGGSPFVGTTDVTPPGSSYYTETARSIVVS
jgi:hypothetical protein